MLWLGLILNINGMFEYRVTDNVSVTANAGTASLDAVVLSGIGTLQADGFSNTYGQLRLQADRFFAQVYASQNDAKDSFVYGTGANVVDKGTELNAQAQYDLDLADDRVRLIFGADYQQTNPDTEGTILGRNESDDEIIEAGGYVQSTLALTSQLDLTVAGRRQHDEEPGKGEADRADVRADGRGAGAAIQAILERSRGFRPWQGERFPTPLVLPAGPIRRPALRLPSLRS